MVVSRLRTMCAAASGMAQRGRCCTTAIALAFSEFGDSVIPLLRLLLAKLIVG